MNNLLFTGLLGVGSSVFAEAVSWVSKKLAGTPLQGSASFIVAALIAFVAAAVKVAVAGGQGSLWTDFGEVFVVSETYFNLIASNFNLTVSSTPSS